MSHYSNTLGAGGVWEIAEAGRFFRLMSAAGPVRVTFYRNGSHVSEIDNVQAGFWREALPKMLNEGIDFDCVRIQDRSGGSNALEVMIDMERIGYDRMSISGSVQIAPAGGTPTQASVTVANSSGLLLAANATRKYLLIQNKSGTGAIFLNFAGAAATTANGVRLGPGQSYESSAAWIATAAINAIGDIANNPDVVVTWGA